jgi:hypothetical protein
MQSIISRALDNNGYSMISILDQSAAFFVVETKLLLKNYK